MHAVAFNFAFVVRAIVFCIALVFCDKWAFPYQVLLLLTTCMMTFGVALNAGNDLWID